MPKISIKHSIYILPHLISCSLLYGHVPSQPYRTWREEAWSGVGGRETPQEDSLMLTPTQGGQGVCRTQQAESTTCRLCWRAKPGSPEINTGFSWGKSLARVLRLCLHTWDRGVIFSEHLWWAQHGGSSFTDSFNLHSILPRLALLALKKKNSKTEAQNLLITCSRHLSLK